MKLKKVKKSIFNSESEKKWKNHFSKVKVKKVKKSLFKSESEKSEKINFQKRNVKKIKDQNESAQRTRI